MYVKRKKHHEKPKKIVFVAQIPITIWQQHGTDKGTQSLRRKDERDVIRN